jgi:tRNA G18 (ribose-2'-O)-methylase SpoU
VQASAGTIGYAHLINLSWQELVQHKNRPALCALVAHGGDQLGGDISQNLMVVGGEANGIPTEHIAQCDKQVTLTMSGPAESLNAAIAGSIALYFSILS